MHLRQTPILWQTTTSLTEGDIKRQTDRQKRTGRQTDRSRFHQSQVQMVRCTLLLKRPFILSLAMRLACLHRDPDLIYKVIYDPIAFSSIRSLDRLQAEVFYGYLWLWL